MAVGHVSDVNDSEGQDLEMSLKKLQKGRISVASLFEFKKLKQRRYIHKTN